MVENLIAAISRYKIKVEYRKLEFDGDRSAQYTQLRLLMAEKYAEKGVELFGPVTAHSLSDNDIQQLNNKETSEYYHKVTEDLNLITKECGSAQDHANRCSTKSHANRCYHANRCAAGSHLNRNSHSIL